MIQTSSSTLLERSRLVSLLTELSPIKLSSADYNLAERLGHLIGLSGSINLAQTLRRAPAMLHSSDASVNNDLQASVLLARKELMQLVTASFDHDVGESHNKVPTANVAIRAAALLTYEPYQRFYTTYQVEIGVEVQRLRANVRQRIAAVSAPLKQLAELDKILEESLSAHNRKLFSVTPKLLEQHFKTLLAKRPNNDATLKQESSANEFENWLEPGAWLDQFYRDMRELLFAEFDVRLQPVFGLLEALNEHTKTTS